jgi:AcrR family transcriptional regulator
MILIDTALQILKREDPDAMTVEAVAEAADVSPRTVARYFPSKDMLLLALLDLISDAVNAELALVPAAVPPLEAMLAANLAMLDRASAGTGPLTSHRFVILHTTMNIVPRLVTQAAGIRAAATCDALAQRMNLHPEDPAVQLTGSLWGAIIVTAWGRLGSDSDDPGEQRTDVMRRSLTATFAEFCALTSATATL